MEGNRGEKHETERNGTGRLRNIGITERDGIRRFSIISKRVTERRPLRCNAEACLRGPLFILPLREPLVLKGLFLGRGRGSCAVCTALAPSASCLQNQKLCIGAASSISACDSPILHVKNCCITDINQICLKSLKFLDVRSCISPKLSYLTYCKLMLSWNSM